MMKKLPVILLSALCASASATTMNIGLDVSGSNPLLKDKNFAMAAAEEIVPHILNLKEGDVVILRSFGDRKEAKNIVKHVYKVSRRKGVRSIAQQVAIGIITAGEKFPGGQSSTNIIGWLELNKDFDCDHGGKVLVITDGLESSEILSSTDFISGKKTLPKPEEEYLKGCEIMFYGVGTGLPTRQAQRVEKGWKEYTAQAGTKVELKKP